MRAWWKLSCSREMPADLHGHKLAINGIYLTVPPTHTSEYSHGIACNQLNISADWWVKKNSTKSILIGKWEKKEVVCQVGSKLALASLGKKVALCSADFQAAKSSSTCFLLAL